MSRKPSGPPEAIKRALSTVKTTESASEVRRTLAVLLPVLHGLSLKETATLVGRSETWVAKERQSFICEQLNRVEDPQRGGRRNQLIPAGEEDSFIESVCQQYIDMHTEWRFGNQRGLTFLHTVRMSFVEFTHVLLEDHIQRKTTRTTVYNLLARTGKRRFADYQPYMWQMACQREIPSPRGASIQAVENLANQFGCTLIERRADE